MSITEDAIQSVADSLCLLGRPEHRETYVKSLQAIAEMARNELLFAIELDMCQAMPGRIH